VQERAEDTQQLIGIDNNFLNRPHMGQQLREKIDRWDYMKLKGFCRTKEMTTKLKSFSVGDFLSQNGRKSLPTVHLIRD
jgi:hypothetical protein